MTRQNRDAEWSALMRAAIAGDGSAYHRLLSDLSKVLRLSVRRGFSGVSISPNDVEDVVQEVVLAIHLKRHTWDTAKPIGPWIAAISRNKMIDELRRRGRRGEIAIEGFLDTVEAGGHEDAIHVRDLNQVLSGLNARHRDIIHSIAVDGHTARDVADRLGMTEVAVRVALHRGLKSLAKKYQDNA